MVIWIYLSKNKYVIISVRNVSELRVKYFFGIFVGNTFTIKSPSRVTDGNSITKRSINYSPRIVLRNTGVSPHRYKIRGVQ